MCTGFERSAHDVFKVFLPGKPLTLKDVMRELGDKRFFLFLGAGNTLGRFVQGLAFEGFLKEEVTGYTLTSRGEEKRKELEQVVAAA